MCGRYDLSETGAAILARFQIDPTQAALPFEMNPDFRPTQMGPVVHLDAEGYRTVEVMRWGLIPLWSPDGREGAKYINARAETVDKAGPFRSAFRSRRALIPAGAFYEWFGTKGAKIKHRISLASGEPLTFAGLWEEWRSPLGDVVRTYCIITCEPNAQCRAVHDRMPVILDPEQHEQWLTTADRSVLVPYCGELIIDPPPRAAAGGAPVEPLGPLL